MEGSVTSVAVSAGWNVSGCTAGGVLTLTAGGSGGAGFRAVFTALPSGKLADIYFETAAGHGVGYDYSTVGRVVVEGGAGCLCTNASGFAIPGAAACMYVTVAHGAAVAPHPQRALLAHHCAAAPGGGCRDASARGTTHRLAPLDKPVLDMPLDLTRPITLPVEGATGVATFDIPGAGSFVAFSCYSDDAAPLQRSALFAVEPTGMADPSVETRLVQRFNTVKSRDVISVFEPYTGDALLLFAQDGDASLLFRYLAPLGGFVLVHTLNPQP